jgi:hypothetical protein
MFNKNTPMKKIFLLLIMLTSVYFSQADPVKSGLLSTNLSKESSVAVFSGGLIDNVSVYPNPVVDILKVSFRCNHSCSVTISLLNTIGKKVYTQESDAEPGNNVVAIDIRNKEIEPGIYFIQCQTKDEIFTRKLIVK